MCYDAFDTSFSQKDCKSTNIFLIISNRFRVVRLYLIELFSLGYETDYFMGMNINRLDHLINEIIKKKVLPEIDQRGFGANQFLQIYRMLGN